jgi:hypothetical protein
VLWRSFALPGLGHEFDQVDFGGLVVVFDVVETVKVPDQAGFVALERLDQPESLLVACVCEQRPGLLELVFVDRTEREIGEEARAAQARVRVRTDLL